MRTYRTSGSLAALAASLAVTALGVVPGAAGGAWARTVSPQRTPSVGKTLAVLKGSGADRYFGVSVAFSGKTAVVGDGTFPAGITPLGRVYVFAKTAKGWKQTAELKAPARNDGFGQSVAVSGTTIVVGAPQAGSSAHRDGAAYVFAKTAKGWKRTAQLKESDPVFDSSDSFGQSVAVSGTTIAAGAPDHQYSAGEGEAYTFAKTAARWKQTAELKEGAFGEFGQSVALSGSTVVAGAPYADVGAGRAFVFAKTAKGWKRTAGLKGAPGGGGAGGSGALFGWSVAVSGTTVVVGEPQRNPAFRGRIYVFTKKTAGWKRTAELKYGGGLTELGRQVAVSGKTLVANRGTLGLYVFTKKAARWKRIATLKRPGADGYGLTISGQLAIVGVPGTTKSGRAYAFKA